jgi:hypothetical protein
MTLLKLIIAAPLLIGATIVTADEIRLNQIQVIGTHNSYHIAPSREVLELLSKEHPELAQSLDYTHRPLSAQFSQLGIRQIELDIFADPEGGLYAKPLAVKLVDGAPPPNDPTDALKQPGLKVLHVQDIDYRTTTPTLIEALRQVKAWSKSHPTHCPIMVLLEVKQESIGEPFTIPHHFAGNDLDAIDAEILSVFNRRQLLTPDDVRGQSKTLREAVTTRGWPLLNEVRGKVMFALDNTNGIRDAYLKGHPSLRGRLLFVSVDEEHPAAAFMKINDAVGDFDLIQRMVRRGFLVRTRADSGTKQARVNDVSTREKAFASGAHFVSTDYPEPDRRFSSYRVRFEDGIVARANPVTGKPEWASRDLERVADSGKSAAKKPAPLQTVKNTGESRTDGDR